MTHTKRQSDPLGRSTAPYRYRLHALCLTIAITGSAWPIQARSIRAAFGTFDVLDVPRIERMLKAARVAEGHRADRESRAAPDKPLRPRPSVVRDHASLDEGR